MESGDLIEREKTNKGKWIVFPIDDFQGRRTGPQLIVCSCCGHGKSIWHTAPRPNFCEDCGADMR